MLRLMIDIGNAPPRTGIGVYGANLLFALRRYVPEIAVEEAGISSIGNGMRPLRRIVYVLKLSRLARASYRGADVVHFANMYVPRVTSAPEVVATIHDVDVLSHPHTYPARYHPYFRSMVKNTLRRAAKIVTVSHAARERILERFSVEDDRVVVAGNCLSSSFIEEVEMIRNTPVSADPYILFVGRLERKKNLAWLVRTFVSGVRRNVIPPVKLVLAGGKGFGFHEIEREIRAGGDLVRWVDGPDVRALARLYVNCAAVVLPSFSEGFGIPLIEAMHCGRPIVASRIPSSLEVAGRAAYLFELDNPDEFYSSVLLALEDTASADRLAAMKQQLLKYSQENFATKNAAVYREICHD